MMKTVKTPAANVVESDAREPVLDPVDRVSEMCFGLFMALSFVGAVSIASAGEDPGKAIMSAALGCNLAWGLVDAVMYLVRAVVARSKRLVLALAIQKAEDPAVAVNLLRDAMPRHLRSIVGDAELEGIRRSVEKTDFRQHGRLHYEDLIGALGVFLLVVLATFPVALPFVLISDTQTALLVSRALSLVMLFGGGWVLGQHVGCSGWKAGLGMVGLGICLTAAIIALGG
jgi:VIT1/CCC1 family predicted Fe2+/Mn2+ transporter